MLKEYLNNLETFEDIYNYCNVHLKDYYKNRIYELYSLVMQEEDQEFCLQSLRCLVYFIKNISVDIDNPSITISENGLFYLHCKINKSSYTIRFKSLEEVNYILDHKSYSSTIYSLLDILN